MCDQNSIPTPRSSEEAVDLISIIIASQYFYAYQEGFVAASKNNINKDNIITAASLALKNQNEFLDTAKRLIKISKWDTQPIVDCCEKYGEGECNAEQRKVCALRMAMSKVSKD